MYLLPDIGGVAESKVVIVEGEKCVHAAKGAWPTAACDMLGGRHERLE